MPQMKVGSVLDQDASQAHKILSDYPPKLRVPIELRLDSENPKVEVWSISELAEGAPKKYGMSHINVCFAIQVESKFAPNLVGRTENVALHTRKSPKTMEELWNYKENYSNYGF
ncbi:hypothetical protein C8R44DRAFT_726978 [Mycena epipterygia]|nr:hypothetical protein C8R44DRAFT_726978 [Mycena epipterygia]